MQFLQTFGMITPAAERKRPVGQLCKLVDHKQARSGKAAVGSGYQMKKGVVSPLFTVELEPGEAVRQSLEFVHPFTQAVPLNKTLLKNIAEICDHPDKINDERAMLLTFWQDQADLLQPESLSILDQVKDPYLRRLLRGVPDHVCPELGQFFHVALWRALAAKAEAKDQGLIDEMLRGMGIVGPIARSNRWPPMIAKKVPVPVDTLVARAWDIRAKIIKNVMGSKLSEGDQAIWDDTLLDVEGGSSVGPFFTEGEVTHFLGEDRWVPTQRFIVKQKAKVRGCDSATVNLVNQTAEVTEKLQLPSTDANIGAVRSLISRADGRNISGWVLDERKAYRQVAISPDHRKYSVVAFRHFRTGKIVFFVMIGHSFGLVAAVYKYNRRSALIDEMCTNIFKMVCFNFYDDKFGFELEATTESAFLCARFVHVWLGAKFDVEKTQCARMLDILGVTYDLANMRILIKAARKQELISEINSILDANVLEPGHAGKLKGKLMFGASQLWGKVGRAFLRIISERQYAKGFDPLRTADLGPALVAALRQWIKLIQAGPPREITQVRPASSDVVLFTDGFTPDQRKKEVGASRIGAVMFARTAARPAQFTAVVTPELIALWLPRATQICMIELLAPIIALATFKEYVTGKYVLLLVDAEAVEGALVKGYSSKEDMCELVGLFWDLALELRCSIYIDRIPTDANCADKPSRDQVGVGEALNWVTVPPIWPKRVINRTC